MSKNEPVDVVIVGAGASGAAVAHSLAATRMHIVCLEQGGVVKSGDYPASRMSHESETFSKWSTNPNTRGRPEDYPVNAQASPISPVMFNAVGGSTILYAAHFPRMRPRDFRVYSDDGVAADWPINYELLEPYFASNDKMMGVSGLAGDPAYPPKAVPLPPIPLGSTGRTLAEGFERLGYHWWPADSAIISQDYEGREKCINLGTCISGCAQGAKGSVDVTYWPEALRKGVELRTHCRVREITQRSDGMADGVLYYDEDGELQEQKAEIVILACNGIGTPRLLLNSASSKCPDGLANSSGLVGKNLMFHPFGMVMGLFDKSFSGAHHGPTGCSIWSHEFYETDPARDFLRGFSLETLRGVKPATSALLGMVAGKVPWGKGHHAAYEKVFDHMTGFSVICEDLPEETNRVTLDPELKDSNGIPAPKVEYRLSDNSEKLLKFGCDQAAEVLKAAGATDTIVDAPMRSAGWHLLGTARMGKDPQTSVVNEWGRSHDVKNLFIVDGSVFVTSGGVNPTSTIQAIALYIADHIKKNLETLFD